MRTRVLHIISGLELGGAEAMLSRLVTRLDPARFEPAVLSLGSTGYFGEALAQTGIPVDALDLRRRPGALLSGIHLIRRFRPHVVQTWLYHADLFGALTRPAAPGARLLWNIRCSDMDARRYRHLTVVLAALARIPERVLVNSEAGRAAHAALGYRPRRWEHIPNGFDLALLRPDPVERAAVRRELGVGEEEVLIGMAARVDPMKDHATFVAAAARVPEARYVLIGRGTERLPHGIGERGDLARLLRGLDVLTLTSAFGEGFPNVLGEAMACGVPCVSTDVGDARAIIGDTGCIVPTHNPEALSAAWRGLMSLAGGRRAELGLKARQRVQERYSIDAIVRRYEEVYEQPPISAA